MPPELLVRQIIAFQEFIACDVQLLRLRCQLSNE